MALVLADRVLETCTSPGTGAVSLLGATTGYQTFSAGIGNGNSCYYCIADQGGANWEVGIGTYNSVGNTLTRTTPISGNAATPVNFSSGTQNVFVTYPAEKSVNLDSSGKIHADSNSYLDFASAAPATIAGRMWYDDTTGSWNLGMGGGNITQQVGEELFIYGKASNAISGNSLLQLIFKTGTVGASGVLQFAPTTSGITDANLILGVATEDIASGSFGRITTFGTIHGINTNGSTYSETWVDGDVIWYNPTTGGLTKTEPSAPSIKYQVGTVINAGPGGSGSFQVDLHPGSILGGTDSNVQFSALSTSNLVQYNGTYWTNVAPSSITGVGSVANAVTFNNSGSGAASGTTFDGAVARTISYNSIGAPSITGTGASGTWGIGISGNAATATTATNQSGGSVNATTGAFSSSVTVAGRLSVGGSSTVDSAGDIRSRRSATTGVVYFGDSSSTYVYYDGSNYYFGTSAALTSGNYNSYSPTLTGTGASGTWGINISGNAANVSGVVAIANGGTGLSSIGANGTVLTSNGSTASWQAASSGASYVRTAFTATAGQTTFSVSYTVGYVEVFVNGVLLNASDYTATTGTSVVLAVAAVVGDIVEFIAYNAQTTTNSVANNIAGGSAGAVVYQSGSGATGFTAVGTSGQVLVSNGTSAPAWQTMGAFTLVSSQTVSGVTYLEWTGLTPGIYRLYVLNCLLSAADYWNLQAGSGGVYTTSGYYSTYVYWYGNGGGVNTIRTNASSFRLNYRQNASIPSVGVFDIMTNATMTSFTGTGTYVDSTPWVYTGTASGSNTSITNATQFKLLTEGGTATFTGTFALYKVG